VAASVLIPAYNEEARLGATLRAVREAGFADEVVVVDDGSQDGTARVAENEGARVVRLPRNLGKGEALNRGAREVRGDVVVLLDADLGASAGQGALLLGPLAAGRADIAVAVFPPVRRKAGFGMVKRLARWALRREGLDAREPLSGQRAMRREVLLDLLPFHSGFGIEVGMSIRALRKGYRIEEVDTTMSHAETGRDVRGFLHRGRQFLDVLRVVLRETRGGGR
jgi:glycosyltransferase involved in cell wall biosynthesis